MACSIPESERVGTVCECTVAGVVLLVEKEMDHFFNRETVSTNCISCVELQQLVD